jgi:hypothetical protein
MEQGRGNICSAVPAAKQASKVSLYSEQEQKPLCLNVLPPELWEEEEEGVPFQALEEVVGVEDVRGCLAEVAGELEMI